MAVTIKDIARKLNLSVSTVASVLGERGSFTEATKQRVRHGAAELGYKPSAAAKAVRTGRYETVGLLMSNIGLRSILPSSLLNAISDALTANGQRLLVARLSDEHLSDSGYVSHLLERWCVDGFLINYNAYVPPKMKLLIEQNGLPAVWLNARDTSCCVYPDEVEGGRLAARRLLALGHKHLAFVNFGGEDHFSVTDRRRGVQREVEAAGVDLIVVQGEVSTPEERIDRASELLSRSPRPTGVIAYTPDFAWPIYRTAVARLGMSVPRDLSIVSFSDLPVDLVDLRMDTVLLPESQMGTLAVELLCGMIKNPKHRQPRRPQRHAIPCRLVTGNLSAPSRTL